MALLISEMASLVSKMESSVRKRGWKAEKLFENPYWLPEAAGKKVARTCKVWNRCRKELF